MVWVYPSSHYIPFWMGISSAPLLVPQPQSCWKWGIHVGRQSVILGHTYGKELLQHTVGDEVVHLLLEALRLSDA